MDSYFEEIGYGYSNETKMRPQLHPFQSFGGRKREKNAKIGFSTFKS